MAVIPAQRIYWLDALKAIGLFCVVLGHTDGISEWLRCYIHSFHIPLFFFLSGYLVSQNSLTSNFSRVWRHHFRSLILPYFTFGLISYLIWLLAGRFYGRDLELAVNPVRPLIGMLYGVGVDHWLRHNIALWFLPSLFSLHLIFYWLRRYCNGLGLLYAVILLSLTGAKASAILPFRLPWGIEPACAGVIFYWAGHACRERSLHLVAIKPLWYGPLMSVCLTMQILGVNANDWVDMNSVHLGNLPTFFLAAFSGIAFWGLVAKSLPNGKAISAMARASMFIFALHTLCFSAFTLIATQWLPLAFKKDSGLAAGCYAIGSIAILTSLAPWIRKGLPWVDR